MNIYLWTFNRKNGRIKNKTYNVEQISTKPNLLHLERELICDISRGCVWINNRYPLSVILYKIPTKREEEQLKQEAERLDKRVKR